MLSDKLPSGSASFASLIDSDVVMSVFPADTARMMLLGLQMYFKHMSLMISSMSSGWSPIATFVMPGRSTRVKVSTFGEYIRRWMGSGQIPCRKKVTQGSLRLVLMLRSDG